MPGAADYIDIVAYHVYMWYQNRVADHDLTAAGWQADYWGGAVRGKTRYLRELMAAYGVSKPMYINELGLICHPNDSGCNPISQQYYEITADHVARFLTRGLADDVGMFSWYTLNGPGWLGSGLLDANQAPRPAYRALQAFAGQTQFSGTPFR